MALIDLGLQEAAGPPRRAPRPRMPKHVTWGLIGLVAGAAAVAAVRSDPPRPAPVVLPAPTTGPRTLPPDASDLISNANRTLAAHAFGGDVVASVASRVLAWPASDEAARDVVFRSTGPLPSGAYTLVLYCVGYGRVAAVLRVGAKIVTQIADCADAVSASQLTLPKATGDVEVRLTAVDVEDIAVSSVVLRA
jgi:hypothetical protein